MKYIKVPGFHENIKPRHLFNESSLQPWIGATDRFGILCMGQYIRPLHGPKGNRSLQSVFLLARSCMAFLQRDSTTKRCIFGFHPEIAIPAPSSLWAIWPKRGSFLKSFVFPLIIWLVDSVDQTYEGHIVMKELGQGQLAATYCPRCRDRGNYTGRSGQSGCIRRPDA